MNETLAWCESIEGKEKCLTSIKAMIDYANLYGVDQNITILRTRIDNASAVKAYVVKKVERKPTKASSTVCHNLPYPSAVYHCHHILQGRIYEVMLEEDDGSIVDVIAACHENARGWTFFLWPQSLPAGKKTDNQNYACQPALYGLLFKSQ
ncbi:hypothetical protein AMTRI_Chr09g20500 [Amborella trichopoda]